MISSLRHFLAVLLLSATLTHANAAPEEFFVGTSPKQMFVQHWAPASPKGKQKVPLIMVHGGLHTGTGFVSTPDGREGWAPLFAKMGWDVYVVDWPGVGRSGFSYPQSLDTSAMDVRDALLSLIERTGPAIVLGHSIGAAVGFKMAEIAPTKVLGIVALAPASMEVRNNNVGSAPPDKQVMLNREIAKSRFANAPAFPTEAFENYFNSLVPYSPRIRNAAVGANDELRIDRERTAVWKTVPVLFLTAELDQTVPAALTQVTADAMGVQQVALGRDWGMPGHGHLFLVERGSEKIAAKVQDWLVGRGLALARPASRTR